MALETHASSKIPLFVKDTKTPTKRSRPSKMQAEVRVRYFIQAVTIMIPINTISQKIKKVNKNRKLKHLPTLVSSCIILDIGKFKNKTTECYSTLKNPYRVNIDFSISELPFSFFVPKV